MEDDDPMTEIPRGRASPGNRLEYGGVRCIALILQEFYVVT